MEGPRISGEAVRYSTMPQSVHRELPSEDEDKVSSPTTEEYIGWLGTVIALRDLFQTAEEYYQLDTLRRDGTQVDDAEGQDSYASLDTPLSPEELLVYDQPVDLLGEHDTDVIETLYDLGGLKSWTED
jgi:hypothetical protein